MNATSPTYCVRHNQLTQIRFTRSTRKHRIGRARVLAVIADAAIVRVQFDRTSDDAVRFLFLGADETGRALEIIALVPGRSTREAAEMAVRPNPRPNPIAGVTSVSSYDAGKPPLHTRNGHELTEDDLDALSAEAEAGYDLTAMRALKPAGVGRKSLAGGRGVSPQLSIRLAPADHHLLAAEAAEHGKTVTAYAREILLRGVRRSAKKRAS